MKQEALKIGDCPHFDLCRKLGDFVDFGGFWVILSVFCRKLDDFVILLWLFKF